MSAIGAMWLRQLKKYWRSKPRMIGSLAQPLLFLVALGFGLGPIFEKAGGGNYIQFLAPGVIAMGIMFTAMFSGIEVLWDRQFGFLKETLVSPSSRFSIFLGRTLGGATVATIQGVLVLVIAMLIGFRPDNILLIPFAVIFMFLIAMMFTAFGTAIATRMEDMQAFPLIMNFIMMPLFFLSGSLFPLESAAGAIKTIGVFNPLSYGVDGLRLTLLGNAHFGILWDLNILVGVNLILFLLGVYLFSKIKT